MVRQGAGVRATLARHLPDGGLQAVAVEQPAAEDVFQEALHRGVASGGPGGRRFHNPDCNSAKGARDRACLAAREM